MRCFLCDNIAWMGVQKKQTLCFPNERSILSVEFHMSAWNDWKRNVQHSPDLSTHTCSSSRGSWNRIVCVRHIGEDAMCWFFWDAMIFCNNLKSASKVHSEASVRPSINFARLLQKTVAACEDLTWPDLTCNNFMLPQTKILEARTKTCVCVFERIFNES